VSLERVYEQTSAALANPSAGTGDQFTQGFGVAVATLARIFDQPGMAEDICSSNGVDLGDFEKAGLQDFDMEQLRKVLSAAPAPSLGEADAA
jgi:hypothetical protein